MLITGIYFHLSMVSVIQVSYKDMAIVVKGVIMAGLHTDLSFRPLYYNCLFIMYVFIVCYIYAIIKNNMIKSISIRALYFVPVECASSIHCFLYGGVAGITGRVRPHILTQ